MADDMKTYDYDTYKYYDNAEKADVQSGLRAYDSVQSCQYWIKGLSAMCQYWDEDTRKCAYDTETGFPSGYNGSNCDHLGRRFTCDKYSAGETEDLDKYWCILPNMFLSGVGKRERDGEGNLTSNVVLYPVSTSGIKGYCGGRCDEYGRGTGCSSPRTDDPDQDAVICNYYRPWQMGFGAQEPRPLKIQYIDGKRVITAGAIEEAYEIVDSPMSLRLPFSFKIYNNRASYQKCLYWDDKYGASFDVNSTTSSGITVVDSIGNTIIPANYCTSTNTNARSYSELPTGGDINADWLLKNIWCQARTVVCNGAKPECPCYTGKWVYCTDEKMLDGMRITANQILEMRFWARNWISQEEYDTYFKKRPNFLDVSTSDIFTFTKWQRLVPEDPSKSIMEGNRIGLCVPASVNKRDFDPENHLTAEALTYDAIGIDGGTTAPEHDQVYFPSLVRDIEVFDYRPLDVIYPYASNDPWSAEVCVPLETIKSCVKRGVSLGGDNISAIGSTIRECSVYVINFNEAPEDFRFIFKMLSENLNVSEISDEYPTISSNTIQSNYTGLSERARFFLEITNFLDYFEKQKLQYIAKSTSDLRGYFNVGPISLNYDIINQIIVLVEFSGDTWDFRKIPVWSQLYGGAIIQDSFEAENTSNFPEILDEGTITGKVATLNGNAKYGTSISLSSLIPVASHQYQALYTIESEYSYCIKKVTVSDEVVYNWGKIGNTSYIWAELEDLNINHLFEWGITSAKIIYKAQQEAEEAGEEVIEKCDDRIVVDLKQKTIESWASGQLSVPPSACILESEDDKPRGFFNNDCLLKVTYWYKKFSNTDSVEYNEEIVWPDLTDNSVTFIEPNTEIELNDYSFTVSKVSTESVAIMAFFNDEEGRFISCIATKLLVWVPTINCRNVEIDYRYNQPSNWYILKPETSMSRLATPPTSEELQGEYGARNYRPPCGDHKNGPQGLGLGAMWYPFTACDESDFYRAFAGSNFCTNYFVDTPRNDMRFCGPTKYTAFVAPGGGSSFADCVLSFHYRYSVTTGEAVFTGYANIVAYVNMLEYKAHSWALPPFGNKGREMVEKWLSKDYWAHLSSKDSTEAYVKKEWMPIVPDKEDFFFSFNAFEEASETATDNFSYTSQLHFMLSTLAQETVDAPNGNLSRKRFEDVFGIRGIWMASYPYPLIPFGQSYKVAHYYFKDTDDTWAWREFWKDIEYVSDRTLFFAKYERPDYKYSYEKEEHRYICEEAGYKITHRSLVLDDEGYLIRFPSIQLGDGPVRYFEIRYDEYDDSYIEWQDEDEGYVFGSDEASIYEKTSPTAVNSKWSHNINILFDDGAVDTYEKAEIAGRKIESLDDEDAVVENYYNRGLITPIKKGNLKHLPFMEIDSDMFFDKTNTDKKAESVQEGYVPRMGFRPEIKYVWYNVSPITLSIEPPSAIEAGEAICISKIFLEGKWGIYKPSAINLDFDFLTTLNIHVTDKTYNVWEGYEICKPGITVTVVGPTGSEEVFNCDPVPYNKSLHKKMGFVDYKFDIPIQPTVNRMFYKQDTLIEIKFTGVEDQFLVFGDGSYRSNYALYKDEEELIYVYERKFFTSTGNNFGDYSLNGPKVSGNFPLQYELDFDNSGVYFPAHPSFSYVSDAAVEAKDKLRSVYADKQYREDESLDITIDNIQEIEQEEQKVLYNEAYKRDSDGGIMTYSIITPPHIQRYLEDNNMGLLIGANGMATFKAELSGWENLGLVSSYKPGSGLWYPQGHKFQWSDKMRRMFCYEMDYMPEYGAHGRFDIMEVKFVHMDYLAAELPSDPYTALYANRMLYQLQVAQKLFGTDAGFVWAGRIMGTAASFVDNSNVGDVGVIT